jgi:DNA-directed RNA polymerase subunit M/transcription elongation factor TFIIS
MQEICPKCGSMDIIPKYDNPCIVICLDCDNEFPAKYVSRYYEREQTDEERDEEELEVDEELMGEELGLF